MMLMVCWLSGSQRSFTGYVFKSASPQGKPFTGDPSLLLSAHLSAPRLKQVTLPRILRSHGQRTLSTHSKPVSSAAQITVISDASEALVLRRHIVSVEPLLPSTMARRAAPADAVNDVPATPLDEVDLQLASQRSETTAEAPAVAHGSKRSGAALATTRAARCDKGAKGFGLAASGVQLTSDKQPSADLRNTTDASLLVAAQSKVVSLSPSLSPSTRQGAHKPSTASPQKKTRAGRRAVPAK
jgi:hypothetical protein